MNKRPILIVDDDPGICSILKMTLEDMGYAVVIAEKGQDALDLFPGIQPAIVITDIQMPGISGIALLKAIKQMDKEVEVIVITGFGDMHLAIQCLKNDATDFITKPISVDALEVALQRAQDRILMRQKLKAYTENLEHKVADSQRDYEKLFNAVPCYISVQNKNFQLLAINRHFKDAFGDASGGYCYSAYKKRSSPCPDCPVAKTFLDGQSHQTETTVTTQTGQHKYMLIHTAPIFDHNQEIIQVMELATDITEVKNLQDRLSTLGLKISSVSHGIKGLLTGLDGGIYIMDSGLSQNNSEKINEGWGIIKLMVERIRALTMDVLYYTKDRSIVKEDVDLEAYLLEIQHTSMAKADSSNITFNLEIENADSTWFFDKTVMRIVLINILENAFEACDFNKHKKSLVSLKARQTKDHLYFDVIDNGIGMDEETVKNLFTLFYSTKGKKGTGLGLFISHELIRKHSGKILVSSQKNKGARFTIQIANDSKIFK